MHIDDSETMSCSTRSTRDSSQALRVQSMSGAHDEDVQRGLPSDPVAAAAARRERTIVTVVTALTVALTFLVYRPDRSLPFDFVDFSEFLPLLERGGSFGGIMREFLDYYAVQQGRFNVVGYVGIALKWSLWGDASPGWQWMRFLTMWAVILLAYRLLRRLGTTRMASAAGASVFLFAPPAVEGWIRLTMAEPLGTVLLLAMCLWALCGHEEKSRATVAIIFGLFCAVLVLLKEMLVATLLLPLALVVVQTRGLKALGRGSRLPALGVATVGAVALAGLPVAFFALRAPAQAYASDFGAAVRPLGNAFVQWSHAISPFDPVSSFPSSLVGLALAAFLTLLVTGWTLRLRKPDAGNSAPKRLLLLSLVFPLLGTAVYLPWPAYQRFYALPYLFAGAALAAVALGTLESRSRITKWAAYGVWVLFLVFAGADAAAQASRMAARQVLNRTVVRRVSAQRHSVDTVLFATDQRAPQRWQELGPTLQRYGNAVGDSMPAVINVSCDESRRRSAAGNAAVLFYSSLCAGVVAPDPIVVHYWRLRLPSLHSVADSIRVDLVFPHPNVRSSDATR